MENVPTAFRDAGDLNHRAFLSPDLADQLLRPIHPEVQALTGLGSRSDVAGV